MKYKRPDYLDPSVKTQVVRAPYSHVTLTAPKFDTPVTPRENFRRSIERNDPLWMPNSTTDIISLGANDVSLHEVRGMQLHSDFLKKTQEDYNFKDWFNTDWTWVVQAGGAMLTPGTQLLEDVTKWEKEIVFPDLSEWGFEEKAKKFLIAEYDSSKALAYDIGRGVTERLVSVMGGYTESMEALLLEPEAVSDFFSVYTDFMISFFDKINSLYPLDMLTLHDDWGTERDTFFSEKIMEELVFEPTKKFIDHVRASGVFLEMHTCGNVTRFFPYMYDLHCDLVQVQRRVVDFPKMKEKYGDRIGFCAMPEGIVPMQPVTTEEYLDAVTKTVNIYAPGGGSYLMMFTHDEELMWKASAENYCLSMELYDKARGMTV